MTFNTKIILSVLVLFFLSTFGAESRSEEKIVLAMGDSLMVGYNLPPGASFPARLEDWLIENGLDVKVLNSGVSGDTSTAGRSRLEWALAGAAGGKPDLFILEFGGNDMLRGIDPALTRENMDAILKALTEKDINVLVMGMRAAPNLGAEFEQEFNAIFPELAKKYGVHLYPFYLEGVASIKELNLEDGIHPNEKGIDVMVENAGPMILRLLQD